MFDTGGQTEGEEDDWDNIPVSNQKEDADDAASEGFTWSTPILHTASPVASEDLENGTEIVYKPAAAEQELGIDSSNRSLDSKETKETDGTRIVKVNALMESALRLLRKGGPEANEPVPSTSGTQNSKLTCPETLGPSVSDPRSSTLDKNEPADASITPSAGPSSTCNEENQIKSDSELPTGDDESEERIVTADETMENVLHIAKVDVEVSEAVGEGGEETDEMDDEASGTEVGKDVVFCPRERRDMSMDDAIVETEEASNSEGLENSAERREDQGSSSQIIIDTEEEEDIEVIDELINVKVLHVKERKLKGKKVKRNECKAIEDSDSDVEVGPFRSREDFNILECESRQTNVAEPSEALHTRKTPSVGLKLRQISDLRPMREGLLKKADEEFEPVPDCMKNNETEAVLNRIKKKKEARLNLKRYNVQLSRGEESKESDEEREDSIVEDIEEDENQPNMYSHVPLHRDMQTSNLPLVYLPSNKRLPSQKQPEETIDVQPGIKRELSDIMEFLESPQGQADGVQPSKRPRIGAEQLSDENRDVNQGETLESNAPSAAEPQPGCSHWSADNSRSSSPRTVAGAGVSSSPPQGLGVTSSSAQVNWENKYNELYNRHKALLTNLQSVIECPICMEIPREVPVPCCRNGHVFCSPCLDRGRIKQCPTCKVAMPSNFACVSNVANALVDLIPHHCKFKDNGCQHVSESASMTVHERECDYREIKCPSLSCKELVCLKNLGNHIAIERNHDSLAVMHSVPKVFKRALDENEKPMSLEPIRFTFDGCTFYLQSVASTDNKFLYLFVQMEGTMSQCCKYKAQLSLISNISEEEAKHNLQITPIDLHCVDNFNEIGFMLIFTEMTIGEHTSLDPETQRQFFKIQVKMLKLEQKESDRLLAKAEQKQEKKDNTEKEKQKKKKTVRFAPDTSVKHSTVDLHIRTTQSRTQDLVLSISDRTRRRLIERIAWMRHINLSNIQLNDPILEAERQAYLYSSTRREYTQRVLNRCNLSPVGLDAFGRGGDFYGE